MDKIRVSHIRSSSPKYALVLDLREAILRVPLGLSLKNEDLSRDQNNDFFIGEAEDKVIGCLALQRLDEERVQLRAMAVDAAWQGKGVGRQLVQAAEQFAWQLGYKKILLHSRKVATGFYASMGYSITSAEFVEVTVPHFMMEKSVLQ